MALFESGQDRKSLKSQLLWFGVWVAVTGIGAWLTPDKSGPRGGMYVCSNRNYHIQALTSQNVRSRTRLAYALASTAQPHEGEKLRKS